MVPYKVIVHDKNPQTRIPRTQTWATARDEGKINIEKEQINALKILLLRSSWTLQLSIFGKINIRLRNVN